jgi:para-aminobenzoate synthetase component I
MTKFNADHATKKPMSDFLVRHYYTVMSAKTSVVLIYLSYSFFKNSPAGHSSDGLIYFASAPADQKYTERSGSDPSNAHTQEVIALFPKVLLTALVKENGIQIVRSERQNCGSYANIEKPASSTDFFKELRSISAQYLQEHHIHSNHDDLQFTGGLAGFIGYDFAAAQHCEMVGLDSSDPERLVAAMGMYDIFLKKEADGWALYGPNDLALSPIYQQIITVLQTMESASSIAPDEDKPSVQSFQVLQPFAPVWSVADYECAFQRIQAYLRAGDCYQVNLTQPFVAKVDGNLLAILDDLLQLTRAPYSGYMRVGAHEMLSCSPELFLSFSGIGTDGHNRVITRPIKGTRPRSDHVLDDDLARQALVGSDKDHSENLMIVDLLRHDLSRHAIVGSVQVPVLFELESFAQVHHLVSEVRATMRPDVSALDVLIDALPGGSITGAPKKRAIEIIAELEAMPRSAYCGSFGYLNRGGSGQFNVLIRTLQQYQDTLTAWAGGGITIASDVDDEYQECFDKIGAILDYVNGLQ